MFHLPFFQHKDVIQTGVYRSIALSFFGISVIVAAIVFYISFSWATVRIVPEVKDFSSTERVVIHEQGTVADGSVSGMMLQRELEGIGTFVPTASETKPGRVTGTITVVNKTGRAQALRETTRFLTPDNILFRSTQTVTVPAEGQVDVSVRADSEGELGAIDAPRFTIPGLWLPLQNDIYGMQFTQKQGGVEQVRKITEEDSARAEAEIVKKLEKKFALLLDTEKPAFAVPAVGAAFRADVVERTQSHAIGDETQEFTLRLKVRFTAALYDEQRFTALLEERMQNKLSSGYELMRIEREQYTSTLEAFDPVAESAIVSADVRAGKTRTSNVQPYHTADLAGLRKDAIVEYFRGYDDIKDVSVSFYPFWVSRAPWLTDHIKIVVDTSAQ